MSVPRMPGVQNGCGVWLEHAKTLDSESRTPYSNAWLILHNGYLYAAVCSKKRIQR